MWNRLASWQEGDIFKNINDNKKALVLILDLLILKNYF